MGDWSEDLLWPIGRTVPCALCRAPTLPSELTETAPARVLDFGVPGLRAGDLDAVIAHGLFSCAPGARHDDEETGAVTTARQYDSVRTTAAAESVFDGRIIPAGTEGVVLEARADGTCLVELALAPQTSGRDGDFVQAVLAEGRYQVIDPGTGLAADRST